VPRGPSLYYEEPTKPKKVITWDEANEARPPLRIDMEGPGPTNYSPRNKPLNETNSPAWTFGSKCFIEKGLIYFFHCFIKIKFIFGYVV
jgi:hypothetical protein